MTAVLNDIQGPKNERSLPLLYFSQALPCFVIDTILERLHKAAIALV